MESRLEEIERRLSELEEWVKEQKRIWYEQRVSRIDGDIEDYITLGLWGR